MFLQLGASLAEDKKPAKCVEQSPVPIIGLIMRNAWISPAAGGQKVEVEYVQTFIAVS